jgi:hypothetical protein
MYQNNYAPKFSKKYLEEKQREADAAAYRANLAARAKQLIKELPSMLDDERKELLTAVQGVKSPTPLLMPNGKLDMSEMVRRMAHLIEVCHASVKGTSERPRPHLDKGGWHGARSPSPGSHSGARREPSRAWDGEFRG